MSKTPMPFAVGDVSAFARSLRRQLDGYERTPSHVEMLNLLVKAGGYRNFEHFKAQHEARAELVAPAPAAPEVDLKFVKRLARFFDDEARLIRWPKKHKQRMVCLWAMWSRIPARTALSELEVNGLLQKSHLFDDHALLRRMLVDHGMLERTPDGREYRRREAAPPAEAVELFACLRG